MGTWQKVTPLDDQTVNIATIRVPDEGTYSLTPDTILRLLVEAGYEPIND